MSFADAPATRTTCPYCGVGCGALAMVEGGAVTVEGDPDHPANFGRLCSKGSALGETMSLEGRLLHPRIEGRRATWDGALGAVASAVARTVAAHGPDSVALYVSGQILVEDYYVANKLMKGFVGTANIDTNSRLCMASSVAGHRRAFGADTVPGVYADLEEADLVVLVGSNLAWCHPILHRRLLAAREARGTKIVVVDPRRTATAEDADLHLPLAPGADVALFAGLLAHLADAGAVDRAYVGAHTNGFEAALALARGHDLARVAALTGLAAGEIADFYALFARTERTVTVYSQGVNQSTSGTDKVNAIVNCHLATGRIGKPGAGPFSVTGQPNAMGGREVGGLANMLAAHLDIEDADHRALAQGFWRSPTMAAKPGLKAVDLFRAVGEGRVRALWIMGTNPAVSMPDAGAVREALRRCPFVAVSEVEERTDTTEFAHVLLPSLAWGEKDGTVTNSERRMSRQRAFLPAPGEARADWAQLAEVGRRMGFEEAFAWPGPAAIFREYAAMTALKSARPRDLDLSGVADIDDESYDALAPFQWPRRRGEEAKDTRFFADGGFFHADGKARFVPTAHRSPAASPGAARPLVLNTGRIRDQWHTMTRTGKTPRLMAQAGEPFLELHPADAAARGLAAADLAEVESAHGTALLRIVPTTRVRRGEAFAPMHWTDRFAPAGRVGALIAGATDPVSGQPELKATPIEARRFPAAWFAFAVSCARPDAGVAEYVALAPARGGFRVELASRTTLDDPEGFAARLLHLPDGAERVAYCDPSRGEFRFAAFAGETFVGALFLAPGPVAAARDAIAARLGETVPRGERMALLAGRVGAGVKDKGPIVCACFEVGRREIADAIAAGAATADAVGAVTRAGANCGSCRPEIKALLDAAPPAAKIAV